MENYRFVSENDGNDCEKACEYGVRANFPLVVFRQHIERKETTIENKSRLQQDGAYCTQHSASHRQVVRRLLIARENVGTERRSWVCIDYLEMPLTTLR